MNPARIALAVSAVLWVIWGIVHVIAGVSTMALPPPEAFSMIADAEAPAQFAIAYPDAVGAVLNQHGWNLTWIGLTTIAAAPFVGRGSGWAMFLAALTGGLADVGYFLFLDLGGHVRFVPGTIMTIVSASAIATSAYGWSAARRR